MTRPQLTALVTDEMFPLPVAWDGRRVEWTLMENLPGEVFICPPPKKVDRCSECQSDRGVKTYRGLVHPLPGESFEDEVIRRTKRSGREYLVREQIPAWAVIALVLWRCRDCLHDVVWEMPNDGNPTAGTLWDLGPEDYGPEGSTPPETP